MNIMTVHSGAGCGRYGRYGGTGPHGAGAAQAARRHCARGHHERRRPGTV